MLAFVYTYKEYICDVVAAIDVLDKKNEDSRLHNSGNNSVISNPSTTVSQGSS
jgi:hypothetical protein